MNIFEKLRLLAEWSPLISYMQRFVAEPDYHAKGLIAGEAAEWFTARTEAEWDDELVDLLIDLFRSQEGEAIFRWILSQLEVQPDAE